MSQTKNRNFLPQTEICKQGRSKAFPWSREQVEKAWTRTHPEAPVPEYDFLCEHLSQDKNFYSELRKLQGKAEAKRDFMTEKRASKTDKRGPKLKKQNEKQQALDRLRLKKLKEKDEELYLLEKERIQEEAALSDPKRKSRTLYRWEIARDEARKVMRQHRAARAQAFKTRAPLRQKGREQRAWVIDDWINEVELFPFEQATLKEAQEQPGQSPYDLKLLRKVFQAKAGMLKPFYLRAYSIGWTFQDPGSDRFPTYEFPWSLKQLQNLFPEVEEQDDRAAFLTFIIDHSDQIGVMEKLSKTPPEFQFTLPDFQDTYTFHFAKENEASIFLPWPAEKLATALALYAPEDMLDEVPSRFSWNEEAKEKVRVMTMGLWNKAPHFKEYLLSLGPYRTTQLVTPPVAPWLDLVDGYQTWDIPHKEFVSERMQLIWFVHIIQNTYDFLRPTRKSKTYQTLFRHILTSGEEYHLVHTYAGILFLNDTELQMMKEMHMPYKSAHLPRSKDLDLSPGAFRSWIRDIYMWLKEMALQEIKKDDTYEASDEELEPQAKEGKRMVFVLNKKFREEMNDYRQKIPIHVTFLTWIYMTKPRFQEFLAERFLSLESKKQIMLETETYRMGRDKKHQILDQWAKVKESMQPKKILEWFEKTDKDKWLPQAVVLYRKEALVRTHQPVPLLAQADRYQQYMAQKYARYTLEPVSAKPTRSNCDTVRKGTGPFFLSPDHAQEFMASSFLPSSPENGKMAIHSVGSGKTCMSVLIAFSFALAGYRIIWATKTALKNQVLKNHVSAICNLLIQLSYEQIRWSQGMDAAQAFLEKMPPETSFASVLQLLQRLGMEWTNLSYQQLTNALSQRNELGRRWYDQARMSTLEAAPDVLRKTLIFVDEPQKIFTGELSRSEMPQVDVLHKALQHSYATSGELRGRIVWLTATPMLESPLPFMAMINMCHQHDVYPMMRTVDPFTKEPWKAHRRRIQEENEQLEIEIGCQTFPASSIICTNPEANELLWSGEDAELDPEKKTKKVEEDDELERQADDWFSARDVINTTLFDPNELRNTVNEFWSKTFGLVSYYNISADYTRFPRTEFYTIIMPSCTRYQEALMAQQLARKDASLVTIQRNIRRIASWAAYKRLDKDGSTNSKTPSAVDREIMEDNRRHLFFEPTAEDIQERQSLLEKDMDYLQNSERKTDLEKVIALKQKQVEETRQKLNDLNQKLAEHPVHTGPLKGQITASERLLKQDLMMLKNYEEELRSFEMVQNQQLNGVREALLKLKKKKQILEKAGLLKKRRIFQKSGSHKSDYQDLDEDVAALDADEAEDQHYKLRDRAHKKEPKKRQTFLEIDQAALNEDEINSSGDESDEDETVDSEKSGELFSIKSWKVTHRQVEQKLLKSPPYQWFDLPQYFNKEAFAQDLPLYSPKAATLLRLLQDVDKELHERRKIFIFCDGIHSIRAVAGALTSVGWTFGMSLKYVNWEKKYYHSDTGELVKTRKSKIPTLTWVPDARQGENYKRFLILTKSRMGGPSGANINEYTVQQVGSMNPDSATYNHPDNAEGKMFRIVIVDRSFMEGIDLPSTVGLLFDELNTEGERTQAVGRISRFCGMRGIPFLKDFGWPQKVFRFGLKFRENALHFSVQQDENFYDIVMSDDGIYSDLIPPRFRGQFLERLQKNIFSPRELDVLLNGRMDLQKLKKRTLDGYLHMLKNINIGAILYEPAMRNLELAEEAFLELLAEESSTIKDYQRFIMQRDKNRVKEHRYNTRAALRDRLRQYRLQSTRILPVVQNYVHRAIRATPPEDYELWMEADGLKRRNLVNHMVADVKKDVYFYDVPVSDFEVIMNELIDNEIKPLIKARKIKLEKNLTKQIKTLYLEARKQLDITNVRQLKTNDQLRQEVLQYMDKALLKEGYAVDDNSLEIFLDELLETKGKDQEKKSSSKRRSAQHRKEKPPKFFNAINKFLAEHKLDVKKLRKNQYREQKESLVQYLIEHEKTTEEKARKVVALRLEKKARQSKSSSSSRPQTPPPSEKKRKSSSTLKQTKTNKILKPPKVSTYKIINQFLKNRNSDVKKLRKDEGLQKDLVRVLAQEAALTEEKARQVMDERMTIRKKSSS